jgi:para-nitrobenzyl esterase
VKLSRTALPVLALSLLAGAAHVPAQAGTRPPDPAVVRTDKGLVRGTVNDDHRLFQGIPYAKPPTGESRWRPPQPAAPWKGVYDATQPRSQCAQPAASYGGEATYVEDCLYLNVTAPTATPRKGKRGLPVMVWVHGGSNITGNGANYDASKLAVDGDVVVVTINYRLGVLGWLAHTGLESGADRRYQAGNYGLLDQQAALRWVRHNITAWGGDPRNVTLFGESAGAADTCANLASPTAAGLFHKAIPQSYGCASPARSESGAESDGTELAAAVGCGDQGSPAETARCLRAVPSRTLLEAFQAADMNAGPVAGGDHVLPMQPRQALERGRFHRVPVMHGNTLDEMRLYVALSYPQPITAAQYEEIVRTTYGTNADRVLALYPAANYPEPRIALAAIQTDFGGPLSTCGHLDALRLFARAGVPTYGYQFADRDAPPLIDVPGFDEGAEHATELTYLFPGLLGELTEPQQRLSDAMVAYWTSFARTGKPATAQAPGWPRFRTSADVLTLAPGPRGIHPTDTAKQSNCAFWNSLASMSP